MKTARDQEIQQSTLESHVAAANDTLILRFAWVWLLFGLVVFVVSVTAVPTALPQTLIVVASGLSALFAARAGHTRLARYLILVPQVVLLVCIPFLANGVRTPGLVFIPQALLFAGWILGRRAMAILAGLFVLVILLSWYLESLEWLVPTSPLRPPGVWMTIWIFVIFLTGAVGWTIFVSFDAGLDEERKLRAQLRETNLVLTEQLEERQQNVERLAHAQRIGHVGISEVDLRTDTALWSEEMLRIYGLDKSKQPRSFDEYLMLLHLDDREAYRAIRAHDLKGQNLDPVEYRIVRPDGEVRWIRDHRGVVRDTNGVPVSLIGMQQDITEQRQADEELRRGRKKMAEVLAALDIARNAVIMLDAKFGITYVNDAAFDILGLSIRVEELIGKRLIDLQSDNPPFLDLVAKTRALIEASGEWQGTIPWKRPNDGRTLALDHRVHRLPNGEHVLVSTDATERLRLEAEDRRHREREAQASKIEALGNLAGGIAHDFNNLLGAVQGFGRFLVEDLQHGTDQREFAERIVAASERGRSMVQQILAFSRRTAIEVADVRLRDIIREAHDMLRATLPATSQIALENAAPDATLFIDKGQLLQVLVNLCINASDALDEKPGTVTVSVSPPDRSRSDLARLPAADGTPDLAAIETWVDSDGTGHILTGGMPKGDSICLSVSDSGSGIPQGMLARVFEPFVTTKEKGKGTGLGLAVIHRIVVDHGGAMAVSTREGLGTRFDIILPLSSGEKNGAAMVQRAAMEKIKIASDAAANVLVVDDDEAYLAMVETALRRIGHRVQSTNDPRVALEWFRRDGVKWDVLITDQTMPHIRGNDLIRQVKALAPRSICILCSGFSSRLSEQEAAAGGADAFLLKPYDVSDLTKLIERHRRETPRSPDDQRAQIET